MSMKQLVGAFVCCLSLSAFASSHQFKHFSLTPKFKTSQNSNELLDKLKDLIKKNGYKAVNSALRKITHLRDDVNLGELNFPDLTWHAGIDANIEVGFVRRLEPMLNIQGWRVLDRIVLGIGAQAYLRNLRDEGVINISDSQLKLFAGIFYKREYSYQHFAATYKQGIGSNFDKLLKIFQKFDGMRFLEIADNEIISKDEYLSADIGMSVETPSIYWMSARGRATVYYTKLNNLSYQMDLDPLALTRQLRMTHKDMKVTGTRLQLELQMDFLKLLKISLMGGEYQRSLTRSRLVSYAFDEEQLEWMKNDPAMKEAFQKVNKGKSPEKLVALNPFKNSFQDSVLTNENMSLYALMWGKIFGNMTEQILFSQMGQNRFLYRHQQERVAFNRSILDTIFRSDDLSKYETREIENILFEYEAPAAKIVFDDYLHDIDERISFRISKEFASKDDDKSDIKRVKNLIETFTNVDGGVINGIDNGKIKAPFYLDIHGQVSRAGILNIFNHSHHELNRIYGFVCAGDWVGKKTTRSVRRCIKKFETLYRPLWEEFNFNQKLALKELKLFLSHLSQKAKNFSGLIHLFGAQNVQLYGTFQGKTEESEHFKTYVKQGDFQGFGVIKDVILSHQ